MYVAKAGFSRRVSLLLLVALASSAVLHADDFWKTKPPSEWSLKQTLKLLEDSPWSRQEVRPVMRNGSGADAVVDNSRYHCDTDHLDPNGNCLSTRLGVPDSGHGPQLDLSLENQVVFLVRWESSAPVEEAFAHLTEIGERATAQYLSVPPRLPADRYVVTLKALERPIGPGQARGSLPVNPIGSLEKDAIGPRARLVVGNVIVPAAESERAGVGAGEAAHFFFPREVNGVPLIPAGNAARVSASFEFRGQRFSVKTRFNLDPQAMR